MSREIAARRHSGSTRKRGTTTATSGCSRVVDAAHAAGNETSAGAATVTVTPEDAFARLFLVRSPLFLYTRGSAQPLGDAVTTCSKPPDYGSNVLGRGGSQRGAFGHRGSGSGPVAVTIRWGTQSSTWRKPSKRAPWSSMTSRRERRWNFTWVKSSNRT
jgi:hypothetical protein